MSDDTGSAGSGVESKIVEALKFVRGGVADKDYTPVFTHFQLKGGRITSCNGMITLSSPIDCDLDCTPKAKPLVLAIRTAGDRDVSLTLRPNGRLCVKAGSFTANIPCTTDPFPEIEHEGDMIDVQPGLWRAFKELAHFMALDASRPWARGILFRGQTAMATNNIVIAEKWLDKTILPYELNIPQESVDELIRISEDPKKIRTNGRSITFYFNQDRWMRTQLLSTAWPDTSKVWRDDKADPVPDGFFEALESLEPFIDDLKRIYITPGRISTSPLEEDGASFEIPELNTTGIFSLPQLMLLKGVAKTLGLDGYPKPCVFYGKQLRGIIVGMRG